MLEHTKRQDKVFSLFSEIRLYFLMFIITVCFLFLLIGGFINLGKTFFRTFRMWNIAQTWEAFCLFTFFHFPVSGLLYWMVCISFLMAWQWKLENRFCSLIGLCHTIWKTQNVFRIRLNSKTIDPVLFFKTICKHLETISCRLLTDGKDRHGLKLGQLSQVLPCLQKSPKKVMVSAPWSWWNLFDIFF